MGKIVPVNKEIDTRGINKEQASRVKKLYKELQKVLVKSGYLAYQIGQQISYIRYDCYWDSWREYDEWIDANLPFTHATARKYLKLYEFFYDNEERIKQLNIMEAYEEAGISTRRSLPKPQEEEGKIYTAGIDDNEDALAEEEELETIFRKKTASGIKLQNYRVGVYNSEIWGFRKGLGRFPLADLRVTKPAVMPENEWKSFQNEMQKTFELYYAKIEAYEETGKLIPPKELR